MSGASRDIRAILVERARQLAKPPPRNHVGRSVGSFATVAVGGAKVGLPMTALRRLVPTPPITELPNLPEHLRGLVMVNGELLSVLDLGRLFGLPAWSGEGALALLEVNGNWLGVLVDRVLGVRTVDDHELADGVADPATDLGLPSLGTTSDLLTLLDVSALLSDPRLIVGDSSVTEVAT